MSSVSGSPSSWELPFVKISLRARTATIAVAALCTLALPALPASAVPGGTGITGAPAAAASATAVAGHDRERGFVGVQLLSVNDFHGYLEPPAGSSGRIVDDTGATVDAGGAEYLATHVRRLRQERVEKYSMFVGAGDLVGGSPLLSALFHDEPTIEFFNQLGMFASATGNHEYDEGITELLRLQRGGCHPVEGCYDRNGFAGADFTYLSANVRDEKTGRLVMPPYAIKRLERGLSIGFIGMPLQGTPSVVTASGVAGLVFGDEVEATDRAVRQLQARGVHAIVLLLHQGDNTSAGAQPNNCQDIPGPGRAIAERVDADVDAVFTAHTHQPYNCVVRGPDGQSRPMIQGASYGRLVSEIDLTLDRRTDDVVRSHTIAQNHVVTRDVPKDPRATALVEKYQALSAPIANRAVGTTTGPITATTNAAGESSIGDLIADAQLAATSSPATGGAQIAFMNPGGIRNNFDAGPVTYAEAFAVQPFNNNLVTMTLTGAQIKNLLAQQFNNPNPGERRILQVSAGFTYTYSWSGSGSATITDVRLNGTPLEDTTTYRVTVNSFLADGGDNFTVLREGTDRLVGGLDIDALVTYLQAHDPIAPPPADRITVLG
jgi:5'-nucleotidase